MAQYKGVNVTIFTKESPANPSSKMDKEAFPTRTHEYTEFMGTTGSLKAINETIVAGLMEALVTSVEATRTYIDPQTGVRVKVAYRVKATIVGSVSGVGVSKEAGEKAVVNGRARAKKAISKSAKRKAARYGK